MSESDSDSVVSDVSEPEIKKKKTSNRSTRLCTVKNGQYKCTNCLKIFPTQNRAYSHGRVCKGKKQMLNKCMWCGLEFTNRGNLAAHAFHIHSDSSYKTIAQVKTQRFTCHVCNLSYKTSTQLRYHIRSSHFNLQAKVPYAEFKKVNQIWFEKVQNSNKIMEIKKTGHSTLIMRTLDENTSIKVNDVHTKVIDLNHLYPSCNNARATCDVCGKTFLKRDFKKHFEEKHLNKKKHACNNCNRTFKRSYLFLKHNCSTPLRLKGVHHDRQRQTNIRITSVSSLSVPAGQ